MDEASSKTMSQAIRDGLSSPLRPQWAQALAFLVLAGLVNAYVPPHEKLIPLVAPAAGGRPPITDPQLSFPVGAQEFPESLLFMVGYIIPILLIFIVARCLDKTDFCITVLVSFAIGSNLHSFPT